MTTRDHVAMALPSGAHATRAVDDAGAYVYMLHGAPVVLTRRDVELLYADSIAADGGGGDWSYADLCVCSCTRGMHAGESPNDAECEACIGTGRECPVFVLAERRP